MTVKAFAEGISIQVHPSLSTEPLISVELHLLCETNKGADFASEIGGDIGSAAVVISGDDNGGPHTVPSTED